MIEAVRQNYYSDRHMLQTSHVAAFGRPFVYMKNHKAACTTILASLMDAMSKERGDVTALDMDVVHTPPSDLLRAGPRALKVKDLEIALSDPDVFKFTIVRDPIARTVSAWADKIAKKDTQFKRLMKHLGRKRTEDLSLSSFLDIIAQDEQALDLDRHWRPQRKEVSFDEIDYNLVGDMADLCDCLSYIMTRLFGEAAGQINDTRSTMGHRTQSRDYLSELTPQDRRNIEIALSSDLEMYELIQKSEWNRVA